MRRDGIGKKGLEILIGRAASFFRIAAVSRLLQLRVFRGANRCHVQTPGEMTGKNDVEA